MSEYGVQVASMSDVPVSPVARGGALQPGELVDTSPPAGLLAMWRKGFTPLSLRIGA